MKKQMLAGLVTASLALGGVPATPAQAGNDDLAKALFGIAAIAIIGTAIHNNRVNAQPAPQVHNHPAQIPARARALPASCLMEVETRRRTVNLMSSNCLSRNYRYAYLLPDHCEVEVRTRRHTQYGFDPRCLHEAGFRLDRHR